MDARAREIAERSGLPMSLAREVAIGRLSLNEALHRLMRRDKADRLMRQHGLSRSAAFNVASGHQSLEVALLAKELQESEARQPDRSVLADLQASGELGTFYLFAQEPFRAKVLDVEIYDVVVQGPDEQERRLAKHDIELVAPERAPEDLAPLITEDAAVAQKALGPSTSYRDRFRSSKRTLFSHHRDRVPTRVVLRDGRVVTGFVGWFGKWEFELALVKPQKKIGTAKPVGSVVIFRHALHALDAVK